MSGHEVAVLSRKMDRILNILENDESTGSKGLIAQVNELKNNFYKFVNKYNIDQAKKKGKETVWKIVWGTVGAGLLAVGKFLIGLII